MYIVNLIFGVVFGIALFFAAIELTGPLFSDAARGVSLVAFLALPLASLRLFRALNVHLRTMRANLLAVLASAGAALALAHVADPLGAFVTAAWSFGAARVLHALALAILELAAWERTGGGDVRWWRRAIRRYLAAQEEWLFGLSTQPLALLPYLPIVAASHAVVSWPSHVREWAVSWGLIFGLALLVHALALFVPRVIAFLEPHEDASPPRSRLPPHRVADSLDEDLAILGVARDASAEEVRRAFRRRALEFHPDRNGAGGRSDLFVRLTQARDRVLAHLRARQRGTGSAASSA